MRRARATALALPAVLLLLVAFALPVGRMVVESFHSDEDWTLDAYRQLVEGDFFGSVFLKTLGIGLIVTALCLAIGFPLAWTYVMARPRLRSAILFAVAAPLLINMVVRVYGWTVILGPGGFVHHVLAFVGVHDQPKLMYNVTGVVIGMVHIFLPFMVLSLAPAMVRIDPQLYEATRTLGAGWWRRHRTVTVPLTLPGIRAGIVLVFTLTQGAFITPLVLGGTAVQVTATSVYTKALVLFDLPGATAVATTLLAVVLLLVAGQGRLTRTPWLER